MKIYRSLASDAIIEKNGMIVLVKRGKNPFKGKLAFPGGHMKKGESIEKTIVRETKEETNLNVKLIEILGVYSNPKRDPTQTMAVAFVCKIISGKMRGGSDAESADWYEIKKLKKKDFGFDHYRILKDYLKWKKKRKTFWSNRFK